MFIGLTVVLLAGLAGGQVIKYSLKAEDDYLPSIGDPIQFKTPATFDTVELATSGTNTIGFVAMLEVVGADTLALVVNAGAITATVKRDATSDIPAYTALTVNASGELVIAGEGDRIVAYSLDTLELAAGEDTISIKIMIQLEPIPDENGARKWQILDAGPIEYGDNTPPDSIYSPPLSSSGGVDVAKLDFYFTCTIDDKGSSGSVTGSVANFAWDIGGDIAASSSPGATVYLLDRHFYQSQTVAMQATDMDPAATENFTVNVNVTEGLGIDGTGRITGALLTVVGTPR